ncbi:MAG: exodeoxyribonuclease VII large subunit, partial [Thermoguttaceae bacterium]
MPDYPLFAAAPFSHRPLSVSELTFQVKELIEAAFPEVWVAGEVSNFVRPQSGHCYLTLKDDQAQLKAVMWRGVASRLRFAPHDGLQVVCRGHLDLYAARGAYQLVIADIVPQGMGALELALRQLREKLSREGLFDAGRKRPLPPFARRIAVVTSPTGAAIHDFLQVLGRRWRGADVLVVPVRVQGEGAAAEIAEAIATVNRLNDAMPIDCIVVTRGGGSMEDLWAFNEEPVVRAIAASRIPVVSAVGHEIDVTLSDLAADVRALTPSEAAELVAPAAEELAAELRQVECRLA